MHQICQEQKQAVDEPVIYITNPPARYTNGKMRLLNFDLGDSYGRLNVIFPGPERPPILSEAKPIIDSVMKRYKEIDRIVLVGDMDLVVYAAIVASRYARVTLLKWHSKFYEYEEIRL